jgi:polyphenol oxidase
MKIEKIERENTIIFSSSELKEKYKILLLFTSRKGGNSKGNYSSLNLGYHVDDDPENVRKNRDKLLNLFSSGNATTGLFAPNQVHGDKIFDVNEKFVESNHGLKGITSYFSTHKSSNISADGLITNISMIPLMVMAADCNLILMADTKKRVVAAVHAGWKGVLKKIELNALNMFKANYGSEPKDILIFIGPSIRKCCFKVTEETLNLFVSTYKNNLPAEKTESSQDNIDYYFIDLVKIIKNNLINSGIPGDNITDLGLCTFCNEENLFFSYRKEKKTGRHAGLIMLE